MLRLNFNLRQPRADKPTAIFLLARWVGNRLVYPVGEEIHPKDWCLEKGQRNYQRAKQVRGFNDHSDLNERLDQIVVLAKQTFRAFVMDNGREPDLDTFRELVNAALGRTASDSPKELLPFIRSYLLRSRTGVNRHTQRPTHPAVLQRNALCLRYLEEYIDRSYRGRRITFGNLDRGFVEGFTVFLTNHKGFANNTVNKLMRTLRLFLNEAEQQGAEMNRAFRAQGVKVPQEETTGQIYLTTEELDALYRLDLSFVPRLERIRDLFLVGAWTGLRFSDLYNLQSTHIQGDSIRILTKKTHTAVTIPLHPVVKAILHKYGGDLPPKVTNQRLNTYIKEVACLVPALQSKVMVGKTVGGVYQERAEVKWKLVTTHTMRRSFASNVYRQGVPARTIMAVTGHITEAAFIKYIRLNADEQAAIISATPLWNRPAIRRA